MILFWFLKMCVYAVLFLLVLPTVLVLVAIGYAVWLLFAFGYGAVLWSTRRVA